MDDQAAIDIEPLTQTAEGVFLRDSAGSIRIENPIDGDLLVSGCIEGDLDLTAAVSGAILVVGKITGRLNISATSVKKVVLAGIIGTDVSISGKSTIAEDFTVLGKSHIGRNLLLNCAVRGSFFAEPSSLIVGDLELRGTIDGDATIAGDVQGSLVLGGLFASHVRLEPEANIATGMVFSSSAIVEHDLALTAAVNGNVSLRGKIGGELLLRPRSHLTLWSIRGLVLKNEAFLGDRVRLDQCDFRDTSDLDKLRLLGSTAFPRNGIVRRLSPKVKLRQPDAATHHEMASVYRRLRHSLESQGNRPYASLFYQGEMRSRLRSSIERLDAMNTLVVGAYWLLSGFGTRPLRALAWFVLIAAGGALAFNHGGFGTAGVDAAPSQLFQFSIQSMVSFLSPPDASLTSGEIWIQLTLRFIGPAILAQFAIALRDRVVR